MVFGENGYDVSLWCRRETSRYYCKCVIRNVFPDALRLRVTNLLDYLRQKPSGVGGSIGINQVAGDLMWKTYCESPNTSLDARTFLMN